MPSLAHRPIARTAALLAALVLLPVAVTTPAAVGAVAELAEVADSTSETPSFARVPAGIPGAARALQTANAAVAGRAPQVDLTLALRDVAARLHEYTGDDRVLAEQLLARPNGGRQAVESQIGAAWPGPEAGQSPECSLVEPICVHWTNRSRHQPPGGDSDLDGVPNKVEETIAVMETVWQTEIDDYGYRRPLTDQRASIDDDRTDFDVYLSDIGGGGYYGYCAIDDTRTFKGYNFYDRAGYCVLDDDFSKDQFPNHSPLENRQVTAAHEFFHAIQFGYDAFEDAWFMEGTAAWIEDEVYDNVNDNRQYLRTSQLANPARPLDTSKGLVVYGSWGFFRHLSERQNVGRGIVRKAWNRADGSPSGPDDYSLQGVARAVHSEGLGLGKVFADFARDNLAPAEYYKEGATYPSPAVAAKALGGGARSTGWLKPRIDHMAIAYRAVKPNNSAGINAKLRIKVDAPSRATGAEARVLVKRTNGTYVPLTISLNRAGEGGTKVNFGRNTVQRVSVALVNASDRFTKCWRFTTPYSCGGATPVDDNRTYAVKFTIK